MKAMTPSAKPPTKHRASKWIPGGTGDAAISKAEANRFTEGLLKIAARLETLPPDFAKNHDHYLHGVPKK